MKRIFLFLFIFVLGCAKSSNNNSNVVNYFGYEKYDFINNVYIPDGRFAMSDSGDYFLVQKVGCEDKAYKIDSRSVDPATQNVSYQLGPIDSTPSFNSCFSDSVNFTLTYFNQDSEKIYYNVSIFGDTYNMFKSK